MYVSKIRINVSKTCRQGALFLCCDCCCALKLKFPPSLTKRALIVRSAMSFIARIVFNVQKKNIIIKNHYAFRFNSTATRIVDERLVFRWEISWGNFGNSGRTRRRRKKKRKTWKGMSFKRKGAVPPAARRRKIKRHVKKNTRTRKTRSATKY